MVGCGKIARTFKRGLTARLPAANRKTKNAAASENPNTTITATAMLSSTLPVRPAFWNVPLWAEIGVYIIGLIAVIVRGRHYPCDQGAPLGSGARNA